MPSPILLLDPDLHQNHFLNNIVEKQPQCMCNCIKERQSTHPYNEIFDLTMAKILFNFPTLVLEPTITTLKTSFEQNNSKPFFGQNC